MLFSACIGFNDYKPKYVRRRRSRLMFPNVIIDLLTDDCVILR